MPSPGCGSELVCLLEQPKLQIFPNSQGTPQQNNPGMYIGMVTKQLFSLSCHYLEYIVQAFPSATKPDA